MIVGRHAASALVMALAISTGGLRAAAQEARDLNAAQEAPEAAPADAPIAEPADAVVVEPADAAIAEPVDAAVVEPAAATAEAVDAEPAAAEAVDAAPADVPKPSGPQVQTLGPDDQRLYLVDHGGTWSMHAESVVAGSLLHSWHEAGGPLVTSKVILDYPFTLSVHRTSAERILEHILEGWSYTLHYDAKGRLEAVRVYSPEPQRMFKTPRLTESFSAWRLLENGAPAAASPQNAAPAPSPAN
ncbi:MAG TPA: hypothetical protein VN634_16965 [Candidatus Limnocylindrales bacterium]|nr:hypothetical protein [Candidatus Limnocylindrales bacterium]